MSDISDKCVACNETVRPRQDGILCDGCSRWQHRTCNTGITRIQYRRMVKELTKIDFRCKDCSIDLNSSSISLPNAESTRLIETTPTAAQLDATYIVNAHNMNDESMAENSTLDLSDKASFSIPLQIYENSLTDDSIEVDIQRDEAAITFSVVDLGSQRGKRKLVSSDGFTFTLKRQNKTSTDWRCSVRNKTTVCPVVIRQQGESFNVMNNNTRPNTHTHASKPGILTAVKIHQQVKEQAVQHLFEPAQYIVGNIIDLEVDVREPESSRPALSNLIRQCNRTRQKQRPDDPTDLMFDIDNDYLKANIPEKFFRQGHWGQALWRKVQENGLQCAYNERDDVYKFLRKVFALPFLPYEHIEETFFKLKQKTKIDKVKALMEYVENTWIRSSVWPIQSWSVFGQSVRTNNDAEGLHNRLNQKARKGNVKFYLLITLLYGEAKKLPMQRKMVSESKLKRF